MRTPLRSYPNSMKLNMMNWSRLRGLIFKEVDTTAKLSRKNRELRGWLRKMLNEAEYTWLITSVAQTLKKEYNEGNKILDEVPAYIETLVNQCDDLQEDDMRRVICVKLGL